MTLRWGTTPLIAALVLVSTGCAETAEGTPTETAGATTSGAALPVTIMGAGDVASGNGESAATARLIRDADPDAVFTTGDNAYPDGSPSDYEENYDPTWGAFRDRTHPVPGNHEYISDGAQAYVDYFGADKVTNTVDGGLYYAWDVGNGWRAYALNTEISTTGPQLTWLQDDLAAHPGEHYLLYAHSPRYTSGEEHGPSDDICPLWEELAATGNLEIVLAGHNHQYERFAPMDCDGRADPDAARSFVIGSGGGSLYGFGAVESGSEFRNDTDLGVLSLVLHDDSYEWEFIAAGRGEAGFDTADTGNAGQVLDKGSAEV